MSPQPQIDLMTPPISIRIGPVRSILTSRAMFVVSCVCFFMFFLHQNNYLKVMKSLLKGCIQRSCYECTGSSCFNRIG